MAELATSREASGVEVWFRQRRASWARRQGSLLLASWSLLAVCVILSFIPVFTEFLLPRGGLANSSAFLGIRSALEWLSRLALVVIFLQLAGGCISYCLPGSDLIGSLSNREFHMQLRRNCLAISYRLALQMLLPAFLSAACANTLITLVLMPRYTSVMLAGSLVWILLAALLAVLAAQLGLRVPGMAIGLRTGLGLLGLLLAMALSSAPVFIIYLRTDSFSDLGTGQVMWLVTLVPVAMLGLILLGLLAWTRIEAPDMIEELDRHSAARRV